MVIAARRSKLPPGGVFNAGGDLNGIDASRAGVSAMIVYLQGRIGHAPDAVDR